MSLSRRRPAIPVTCLPAGLAHLLPYLAAIEGDQIWVTDAPQHRAVMNLLIVGSGFIVHRPLVTPGLLPCC